MPEKQKASRELFVRWGKFEVQALGVPAIAAVVVFALLGARWLGLL